MHTISPDRFNDSHVVIHSHLHSDKYDDDGSEGIVITRVEFPRVHRPA